MTPRLFEKPKSGFNFLKSGNGSNGAPNLSFINNYRAQLGRTWANSPLAGAENDDDILFATYVLNNPTSSAAEKMAAEATLDKKLYGGPAGPSGPSGPTTAQTAAGIAAELENLAGLFGLPPQDWTELSFEAAKNNWNAAMIRNAIADRITMETTQRAGLVKNVITKSRDLAANYLVQVGDEEALGWAKQIARGEMDEESLVTGMRDRAKSQYYWLAPIIDQGVTLKEYFQPHRETIAKLMEVSADSVDFINNDKWRNVVRYQPPGQPQVREMNLSEVEEYVRNQEDWKKTSNAKSSAASASVALGRIFGAL